jgi:hypothetical protein|tara:strand:- start:1510 stop:1680 length:171 start_codon:yes stop_codon:yes gene_type:complete
MDAARVVRNAPPGSEESVVFCNPTRGLEDLVSVFLYRSTSNANGRAAGESVFGVTG